MASRNYMNNLAQDSQAQNFKAVNNLLTLQENHVEEFFQYHGEEFLAALEKLVEDVVQRVVSGMLSKLEFTLDAASNRIHLQNDCLNEYTKVTQENIDLDIQQILNTSVNSEVILQRKMAKQQYLEAQGFAPSATPSQAQFSGPAGMGMGATMGGVGGAAMGVNQGLQSGYPVPPNGYDQMNNPYWIDPQTGEMTYSPPNSGLGLGQKLVKAATWAKWLA